MNGYGRSLSFESAPVRPFLLGVVNSSLVAITVTILNFQRIVESIKMDGE